MGLLVSFFFFFNLSLRSEELKNPKEMSCSEVQKESKERIQIIRDNTKKKFDITTSLPRLEELISIRSDCVSWEKLKLRDQEIAMFRKYLHAPDKSFDLGPEDCVDKKVDTSKMPDNRNQEGFEWCHSFVAADLISFYEGEKLSAYDFAVNHLMDQGVRTETLEDYKRNLKSIKKAKKAQESDINFTQVGARSDEVIENAKKSTKGICFESEFNTNESNWEKFSSKLKKFAISRNTCFGGEDIFDDLGQDILTIIEKLSPEKKISALLDLNCKKRHFISKELTPKVYNAFNNTPESLVSEMEKKLMNNEPVGFIYDAEMIFYGENYKIKKVNHISTIIGRRYNKEKGQCEFQIRNSWGIECPPSGSIICENGNYWVSRTTMRNNIFGVLTIEKDK